MESIIRNKYLGNNTPRGFFNYYNSILNQIKVKKIFCLKGGPGTGKSTLIKSICKEYIGKEKVIEIFKCSSDPDSADGVFLPERGVIVVDGTAPHIIDPIKPGLNDEIVDLGQYWNHTLLRKYESEITLYNKKIKFLFNAAYHYLNCGYSCHRAMEDMAIRTLATEAMYDIENMVYMKINRLNPMRLIESKNRKNDAMGIKKKTGSTTRCFATAITPQGIMNEMNTLTAGVDSIIKIKTPLGFPTELIMRPVVNRIIKAGCNVEEYYCSLKPENKLEHIISEDAGIAVITTNEFHDFVSENKKQKVYEYKLPSDICNYNDIWDISMDMIDNLELSIKKAIYYLSEEKKVHDNLEKCYTNSMNYEKVNEKKDYIIKTINDIAV